MKKEDVKTDIEKKEGEYPDDKKKEDVKTDDEKKKDVKTEDEKKEDAKTDDTEKEDLKSEVDKSDVKTDDKKKNVIKVKYSLNKIKNLEVAKVHASRPVKIARLVTNDTNSRYELNSGQYLHLKDLMAKYIKDQSESSENGEVSIKVEKNSAVEDKDENNPETQIKMTVTNNKTNEKTNVNIKMYHSNQSIHLQGGRRMGKVTSTSLVADCMEKHWIKNMKDNIESIKEINLTLKVMVIKAGMVTRARTSSGDPILFCENCEYKCSFKHQLNMHIDVCARSQTSACQSSKKKVTANQKS